MKSVLFDSRGNLQTSQPIELSLEEIEHFFVKPFNNTSARYKLFDEYKRYTLDLRKLIGQSFYQWIDGSFISNGFNPNDIDFISFINHDVYSNKEHLIDERFSKWAVAQHYLGLDSFTVWRYPTDHKQFILFQADCIYWQDLFRHTRYNRNQKRFTKGFIQVNVD